MNFKLTQEQEAIVNHSLTGKDLVIEAYAGASKSTTLYKVGEALHKKGLKGMYLAFNKAIADESRSSFPESVESKTVHSLAYAKMSPRLRSKMRLNNPYPQTMADKYGFDSCFVVNTFDTDDRKFISVSAMWSMVKETVRNFCTSSDKTIKPHHFAKLQWMTIKPFHLHQVEMVVVEAAKKYWLDIIDENSNVPMTHDAYLKLYSLSDEVPKVDYLLVDEAQDVNAVMCSILERFKNQVIVVGDSYQNIYRFNRTVNILKTFEADKLYLTKSFRFGDNVESFTNEILNVLGSSKSLKGNESSDGITYFENPPNTFIPSAILCRTNAGCIEALIHCMEKYPELSITTTVDFKQLSLIVNSYIALSENDMKNVKHPALYAFKDFEEMKEYLEEASFADDLTRTHQLVKQFGAKRLLAIILNWSNNRHKSDKPDITITTAHKSKGLGFDKVSIFKDFTLQKDSNGNKHVPEDELNLFYVAVTRTKKDLDLSQVTDYVEYIRNNR